jgi:hypothetical protein
MASTVNIDPKTGEVVQPSGSAQIDPNTGEVIQSSAPAPAAHWYSPSNLGDLVTGAAKGAMNTVRGIGNLEAKIPGLMSLLPGDVQDYLGSEGAQMNTATNTPQKIGKGIEQAGEFLIPGAAEEAGAAKLTSLAPKLGEAAPRILTSALSSGLVNKAQGGSATAGALVGGLGGAASEGMKAIAPALAESALGVRKIDRAYARNPGKTILEETTGLTPSAVADSAQGRLNDLTPQLENLAQGASSRQAPRIAGFLPPPTEDLTLAPTPAPRNPRMHPMAFDAEVNPENPFEPRSGDPMAPISDYPGINPHYLSGSEHPELSGRIPTTQGVLVNHQPITDMSASIPPTMMPNTIASLSPARDIVSGAMGTATQRNAGKEYAQLAPLRDFLSQRFDTGETIPGNVTPSQLLNLRRGFADEFVHTWNPETMPGVTGTARQTYHALSDELHNAVPGTAPIDSLISNLIPVAKRAESADLNAGAAQRIAERIGRPTGGMLPAAVGAHLGGPAGAVAGMILPDLTALAAPKLAAARAMYSPMLRPLFTQLPGGAALNAFDRDSQ